MQRSDGGWSAGPRPELDSANTLVMVFGPSSLLDDPDRLAQLLDPFPRACTVGCSTAGEIFDLKLSDDSLVAAVVKFEHTRVEVATARIGSFQDSFAAGESIARRLSRPDLRAVMVFSDGLRVNGSELVRGINSHLDSSVVVTGGLAGDGDRFARTWVLEDRKPQVGVISAVGLYGERLRVGHGSKGGWDRFGPERLVTRATGNILYELDGKPALRLYKEYLGERAAQLPSSALLFPLALREDRSASKSVVRTILSIDEERQALVFAGDIPEGALAQLMRANYDRLIQGASDAAANTLGAHGNGEARLAIAVSCVGRRLVLGQRAEEEIEANMEVLPPGTRQIGFYSYGEIAPSGTVGTCDLHNQTMTLTTLTEE